MQNIDWLKQIEIMKANKLRRSDQTQSKPLLTQTNNQFLKDLQAKIGRKLPSRLPNTVNPQKPIQPLTPKKVVEEKPNNFVKMSSIAIGAFGFVYRVYQPKLGLCFAQKSILKSVAKKHEKNILSEIKIQLWARHQNLVPLYHVFSDEFYVHLIMELIVGDNLARKIAQSQGKITVNSIRSVIKQTLCGLEYLHSHKIVHRDIKPQNILVMGDAYQRIKLCDFGFAYYNRWDGNQCLGTFEYMAPELVSGQPYNQKIDIWSVGVVLYQLATGQAFIPQSSNRFVFLSYFKDEQVDYTLIPDPNITRVVKSCLKKDPTQRLSCSQLLQDPWFFSKDP